MSSQTPARFFAPASVSTSSPPPWKREPESGRLRPLLAGLQVADAAGRHQVDEQDTSSPSSVGKSSRLARRSAPAKPPALERRERRVERLQRRDVRRAGLLDRERAARARRARGASASISGNSGIYAPAMAEPLSVAVHARRVRRVRPPRARAWPFADGEVVAAAGDPIARLSRCARRRSRSRRCRSRARYPELGEEELAIAAASHFGTERHVEAVRTLLAATGGSEEELDCGLQDGPTAGADLPQLLRQARRDDRRLPRARLAGRGLPPARAPAPAASCSHEVAAAAEVEPREVATAIDGCGVVCLRAPARAGRACLLAARAARRRRPRSPPRCARARS